MTASSFDPDQARRELYQEMNKDLPFEQKAERVLHLGEQYLDVDNGHLTRIEPESDYWKAIASTDPADGLFPSGQLLDLQTTYCRRTIEEGPIVLSDAPKEGWVGHPAFEEHGLHCYHGSTITVDGEIYGTVCFVSREPRDEPFATEHTMFADLIARVLEHELNRQRTQRKLDRLDTFASAVSHDLRNPLDVAQTRLELERDSRDSEHLDHAANALDRMETVIDSVLAVARQGKEVTDTKRHHCRQLSRSVGKRSKRLMQPSRSSMTQSFRQIQIESIDYSRICFETVSNTVRQQHIVASRFTCLRRWLLYRG